MKRLVRFPPRPAAARAVSRVGLGVVILLAGLHKFVDPGAWGAYLAPAFATRWPVDVEFTMVLFGVTEVPVGVALLADWRTRLAAAVVAVSIAGTALALVVLVVQTGTGADVLIRDLAILALAVDVTLRTAPDGEDTAPPDPPEGPAAS